MTTWFLNNLGGPAGLILLGVIISAIGAFWAGVNQSNFERELRDKNDKIAELNQKMLKTVTGGDSFCYVANASLSDKTNRGMLTVVQQGEYPLYDLSVRICDLDKFDEVGDQYTFEALDYIYEDIDIGNLIGARLIKTWSLDPNKINRYNIFFSARNGFFTQQLRYQVVNDKWVKATKVTKDENTLLEEIDKEYPRNEKGEVEW